MSIIKLHIDILQRTVIIVLLSCVSNAIAQQNISSQTALTRGDAAYMQENYAEAMRWYRIAADQGMPEAENDIAHMFKYGEGVKIDYNEALNWALRSANKGFVEAEYTVGTLYTKPETQDFIKALDWFHIASNHGNFNAKFQISNIYLNGLGVPRNFGQALYWAKQAAMSNDPVTAKQSATMVETILRRINQLGLHERAIQEEEDVTMEEARQADERRQAASPLTVLVPPDSGPSPQPPTLTTAQPSPAYPSSTPPQRFQQKNCSGCAHILGRTVINDPTYPLANVTVQNSCSTAIEVEFGSYGSFGGTVIAARSTRVIQTRASDQLGSTKCSGTTGTGSAQ